MNTGIANAINDLPQGIKSSKEAIAETIENNVRRKIIKEHLIDPAYFEEMSKLLNEIIKERKANAVSYEEYLKKIAALAKRVNNLTRDELPARIQTPAQTTTGLLLTWTGFCQSGDSIRKKSIKVLCVMKIGVIRLY